MVGMVMRVVRCMVLRSTHLRSQRLDLQFGGHHQRGVIVRPEPLDIILCGWDGVLVRSCCGAVVWWCGVDITTHLCRLGDESNAL